MTDLFDGHGRWMATACSALGSTLLLCCGWAAAADQAPAPTAIAPVPPAPAAGSAATDNTSELQEVTVTAQRLSLIGTASTASQGIVVNDELALTPAYRPAQLLETVPSLDVTSHSGEGKANQYLLRGYNLDHGTDLAIYVDGMPVNEPTHAHGQGYADLNFMIPELVTNISYTKGTYYADVGDFGSVGSIRMSYLDNMPAQISITAGSMDFQRIFSAGSASLGDGKLLGALELQHYDGPWVNPDAQRKINTVLRYSAGDAQQGYSLTGMFYHDGWNATTDQPQRAIVDGLISRFGSLDPSDGGLAQRASLSGQLHTAIGGGQLAINSYLISNHLTLWNDFTHFLIDPVNGDQEEQHEDRTTVGAAISYATTQSLLGFDSDLQLGTQARYDFNNVKRMPAQDRIPIAPADDPPGYSESDQVRLDSNAVYAQSTTHWNDRFRSVVGLREDFIYGNDAGTNHGSANDALFEPKGSLIFRAATATEIYVSVGRGFHSDDLRGVNQATIKNIAGAPLIASQTGEEIGLRQQLFDGRVAATAALYSLKAQSETTYDPDVGQDSAGPGSIRRGYEVNVTYQARRWLEFYGSYSGDRARFVTPYDDGTGHVGYFLPNAPFATGSFSAYLKNLGPWSGSLEYRYLGDYPLSSDDRVQGVGYGEWNGDVHYAVAAGWSVGLGVYNILNIRANAMEYWYTDRLPGEPDAGISDLHSHPLEPRAVRLTLSKQL